jgi:hypothetical protein
MDRPTRREQARAILDLRGHRLAAEILQRRPVSQADYEEAFNLERIDLVAEISGPEALLGLGHNRVGPRDGLYILDDGGSYRVYIQERGIEMHAVAGIGFGEARDAVIDRIIMLQGLPFQPPG